MGFDRGEIRIKATNISIMDRKGGKSIMGCRVMSGAITTAYSGKTLSKKSNWSNEDSLPFNNGIARDFRQGMRSLSLCARNYVWQENTSFKRT